MKHTLQDKRQRIKDILQMFLRYNETGLAPFMTGGELPNTESIAQMYFEAHKATGIVERVQGGSKIPYAQTVIEIADSITNTIKDTGGLCTWQSVFSDFAATQPEKAEILIALSQVGGCQYPTVESVAEKKFITNRQLYRIKHKTISMLAREIINRCFWQKTQAQRKGEQPKP